jgi:WD40 repeat protein
MMKHFLAIIIFLTGMVSSSSAQRELKDTVMGLHHHTNDINKAVFSLDGRRLISAGMDRTVHFYDAVNWIELSSYSHFDEVISVAISRDNAIIASASKDNIIKVVFLDSAKTLEFKQESDVTGIVIDYGMRFLYSSSSDGHIRAYDLRKGENTGRKFPLGIAVTAISVSHNNLIFAGLRNGRIKVLNNLGKEVKELPGHQGSITDLHFIFYKNLLYLASSGDDYLVKVWDIKTYKEVKTFKGHTWRINSVELSRDLKYVLSASNDGTAKIWDLSTGEALVNIPGRGPASRCISIAADNLTVATVSVVRNPNEYIVYLWNPGLVEEKKPKEGAAETASPQQDISPDAASPAK